MDDLFGSITTLEEFGFDHWERGFGELKTDWEFVPDENTIWYKITYTRWNDSEDTTSVTDLEFVENLAVSSDMEEALEHIRTRHAFFIINARKVTLKQVAEYYKEGQK